jgi:chromosomal replication initiator protein
MKAWEYFLSLQETELGVETVQKWLKPLKVMRFDACNLYLEARDAFQVMWFEEHIRKKLPTKLLNNNSKKIKVHLSIANAPNAKAAPTEPKKVEKGTYTNLPFAISFEVPDPHCTFANFAVSENNFLSYKVITRTVGYDTDKDLIQESHELGQCNPIYLYGSCGAGKTHLLMAAAQSLKLRGLRVIYTRAETFTEHVVSAIRAGEMSKFRHSYRNVDVLCIDDVHVLARKNATQEEFFHTFNTLHLAGKQIFLSANCAPGELQHIEPRLISRFEWGIVLPLETPGPSEFKAVLQKKAEALNYVLHVKVADFLLETFKSSTKALTKAVEALILRSHLHQNSGKIVLPSINTPLAKQYLSDLISEEQQSALTATKIIQTVSLHYDIGPEDILGKAQTRECVVARQMAMFICRNELKMPFTKIGDLFAKDHSTVMSSVKQIQKGIEADDQNISSPYSIILKKIKA